MILALAAAFLARPSTLSAEVTLRLTQGSNVVRGGSVEVVGDGWTIVYGTVGKAYLPKLFPSHDPDRVYFRHGAFLRLIDTRRGIVLERWRFPWQMTDVEEREGKVFVRVEGVYGRPVALGRTFQIDLSNPRAPIPSWPDMSLLWIRTGENEIPVGSDTLIAKAPKPTPELVSSLREAVRRDPLSPYFQIALGILLQKLGDPAAHDVFQHAISIETSDYTELIPISGYLDTLNEPGLAREAFERGYRDFYRKGYDPRLQFELLDLLIYRRDYKMNDKTWQDAIGREEIERMYRLFPFVEFSDIAYEIHASAAARAGDVEASGLWHTRAEEARKTIWGRPLPPFRIEQVINVASAALVSVFIFAFVMELKYRRQLNLDSKRSSGVRLFFWTTHFVPRSSCKYWTRRERAILLSIIVIGWVATGVSGDFLGAILRSAKRPFTVAGSFAGPWAIDHIETGLPPSPERDVLLGVAYLQDGQMQEAEELFRKRPQFAESWNNLGVILRNRGNEGEATQAFEHALSIDPALHEAALNLGRPPSDMWTRAHREYVPDRPMIAPPLGDRIKRAYVGGSILHVLLRSWRGPFGGLGEWLDFNRPSNGSPVFRILLLGFSAVLLLSSVIFMTVFPVRDVTQAPGRWHAIFEIVFPGSSRAWRWFGAPVLVLWVYFLLELALFPNLGGTNLTYLSLGSNIWGVPWNPEIVIQLTNPPHWWLYGAPVGLFVVNLAVVLQYRRKSVGGM